MTNPTDTIQKAIAELREAPKWEVKCLRETFCPIGALLIGPEIKTGTIVCDANRMPALLDALEKADESLRRLAVGNYLNVDLFAERALTEIARLLGEGRKG